MKKKRMIVIGILGVIIIILIVGIMCLNKKKEVSVITLSEFQDHFTKLSKQNKIAFSFEKDCQLKDNEKYICQFADDFYMGLSYNKDKQVAKAYYYVPNDKDHISKMNQYLTMLVTVMNPNLTKDKTDDIVKKLTNITGKKADEVGFLVEFQESGNSYMTLEKEDGKYLSFFIYKEEA